MSSLRAMRKFEILFDEGEGSESSEAALYGKLGFPAPVGGRPWVYANFVQTLDGIVSLLGAEASGSDIGGLQEDRWLMDLLRAHADALIVGIGTLREERNMGRPRRRGPVFRIMDAGMQQLRTKLGRGRERNVLVTARADFQMSDYAIFDGDHVDVTVVTTHEGARRLEAQHASHPWVDVIATDSAPAAHGKGADLKQAVVLLKEHYGVNYLLCEGGPQLYTSMVMAELIDEKFLTVSPMDVGLKGMNGLRPTIMSGVGFGREDAVRWRWLSCRKVGDFQFHRFRRKFGGIC